MGLWPERGGGAYMVRACQEPGGAGRRPYRVLGIVFAAMTSCMVITGCASRPHYSIDESPAAQNDADTQKPDRKKHHRKKDQAASGNQAADSKVSDDPTMRSSSDQDNNWGDAFTAPLEDLNLKRQAIPGILETAITKPYDLTGLDTCEAIAGQVAQLDVLLGADFDEPPPPPSSKESMTDRGQRMANHAAVGAVRNASRSIIPFRGIVRKMTGAEQHQKEVDTAIQAGKVRRAYLKGVGMNKNCAPPAAPSWFKPRVYVQTYTDGNQTGAPPKTTPATPEKSKNGRRYR